MSLIIFNTLSGKKEVFEPVRENIVGMYVCGVTVYDIAMLVMPDQGLFLIPFSVT